MASYDQGRGSNLAQQTGRCCPVTPLTKVLQVEGKVRSLGLSEEVRSRKKKSEEEEEVGRRRRTNAEVLHPADGLNMLRKKSAVNWGV